MNGCGRTESVDFWPAIFLRPFMVNTLTVPLKGSPLCQHRLLGELPESARREEQPEPQSGDSGKVGPHLGLGFRLVFVVNDNGRSSSSSSRRRGRDALTAPSGVVRHTRGGLLE